MIKLGFALLGITLVGPAADSVPRFDIQAACRAQTSSLNGTGETMGNCVKEEQAARDKLAATWSHTKPSSREICVGEQQGIHSYVDLAACLDMYASQ
ncbi:hypothetical protein SLNSH_06510 [Alsobacter soli]|uniref:Uncharacterized protein n=1 Tax=Alsobacter soli TaxID=2109933 RepID=A0A2T1HWQ3_9HYPH|nr:hypothetical protein [Alsobacter soli]PSC06020.1 hypothetical protein SLNSH_06510 [Alsobacter soli]